MFISILTGKLPAKQQKAGRNIGLALALGTRLLLLFALVFIMDPGNDVFSKPLFKMSSVGIPVASISEGFQSFTEASAHGEGDESEHELEQGFDQHQADISHGIPITKDHSLEIDEITLRDLVLLLGMRFLIAKKVYMKFIIRLTMMDMDTKPAEVRLLRLTECCFRLHCWMLFFH